MFSSFFPRQARRPRLTCSFAERCTLIVGKKMKQKPPQSSKTILPARHKEKKGESPDFFLIVFFLVGKIRLISARAKLQVLIASSPTISSTDLTLFSECFASFPHGTCVLSVSGRYLALDEVYHPSSRRYSNLSLLSGVKVITRRSQS